MRRACASCRQNGGPDRYHNGRTRPSPAFGRLTGSKVTQNDELDTLIEAGQAHMVNVGEKSETHRMQWPAAASTCSPPRSSCRGWYGQEGRRDRHCARGGHQRQRKRTSDLVPLCHPIGLTRVAVDFELDEVTRPPWTCTARCECYGKTGVEMEALTAVQVGLLTIYDMCASSTEAW